MTPLLEEYVAIQRESVEKWGEETVVFMMVGSFYEVYEIMDEDGNLWGGARSVSDLCHIVLTRKNKNIPFAVNNPYMCGFPLYCRDRYMDRLTTSGYTVVVYDQEEKNPTRRVRRMTCGPLVTSALTMSAEEEDVLEHPPETAGDQVGFSVLVDRHGGESAPIILSLIMVNLTTGGVSMVEQCFAQEKSVRDFLEPVFLRHSPLEVCWWGSGQDGLLDALKVEHSGVVKWHHWVVGDFRGTVFQEAVFQKAFGVAHEQMALERHPLTAANLAGVLDFLHQQYPLLLKRLAMPVWGESQEEVDYLPHTLAEMHVVVGKPSLFQRMDQTCTRMGHRRYRGVWFSPKTRADVLDGIYDETERCLAEPEKLKNGRSVLRGFHDWESTMRRMQSGCFSVRRMLCLWRDLEACVEVGVGGAGLVESLQRTFIRDNMERMDWTLPFTTLHSCGDDPLCMVPLEKTDPLIGDLMEQVGVSGDRVVIQTTRDDVHVTIRRMPKSARTLQNGFVMRSVSGTTRIFHPVWTQRMVDHYALRLERERVNRARFHEVAEAWFRTSREGLGVVMEEIIQRDIVFSRAEAVRMYHLTRPVYQSDQSGLVCRNLRNPIVEAVQPSVRFVTNDFAMADGKTGMLLFGQNSAGKSTYVKSIGMNVWLAQTGHFVFADEFRAGRPFEKILTKLSIQDNLFRGISTFQNEMMDLRYILARSVERPSLILSDELTAGTETWSATAIIASTLHELLHRQNTTFVFTTHLHTLQLYQEVYGHASLQAAHIRFSKSGSSDPDFRKILPGEGPVMYGIEIAEDLGFSPEFISRCFHYRQRMEGHIQVIAGMSGENNNLVSLRPSRYNRLVKMDRCEKCGSTKFLHAHHKHHQNDAVKHPFSPGKIIPGTGGQSIHSAWNLRVLCQSCHHDEHRG